MYTVVGFVLGLGLSYVVFPFPSVASGDEKGIERLIVTACVTGLAFGLGKLVQAAKAQPSSPVPPVLSDTPLTNADASKRPMTNAAQEIRALAELRDDGILTQDEFETKKRRILDL